MKEGCRIMLWYTMNLIFSKKVQEGHIGMSSVDKFLIVTNPPGDHLLCIFQAFQNVQRNHSIVMSSPLNS